MKIQIVIPAINLWNKYTKQCIESLETAMVQASKHSISARILLIDNASTDETKIEAGKKVSDTFSHKRNEERWGFQRSVNFGINDGFERGYDYVLVCNNDIVLHPEALWRIGERFEKGTGTDEMLGMVTCMDIRGEMDAKGIAPHNIEFVFAGEKESVDEAPHPNFSAFAISLACWEEIGEFDELFAPAYFEDNDIHYRMKLAGIDAIVYPPAMFYHYGSRTQNEAQENGEPFVPSPIFEKNREKYVKKWGGVPGEEKFQNPYNDISKDIWWTKQCEQ